MSDIYHPDVAFTDSGYPTLVKLGYSNILCCKGAYGTNGDMLFAHTDGTVDCCPVASSGGNMMFVKDPVYGSQGGPNKYTGKYFSLPYGTCQVYVPPVTDEITTTEETTVTDTVTEPEETSTEWCEYVCESDSPGYNEQACEEYCYWIGDPVSNEPGENSQKCCTPGNTTRGKVCPLGGKYSGDIKDLYVDGVSKECCDGGKTPTGNKYCSGTSGAGICCKGALSSCKTDDNGYPVCCANSNGTPQESLGGTYQTGCNDACCPSGQKCITEKGVTTCRVPIDIETDTIEQPEETNIPETTDPSWVEDITTTFYYDDSIEDDITTSYYVSDMVTESTDYVSIPYYCTSGGVMNLSTFCDCCGYSGFYSPNCASNCGDATTIGGYESTAIFTW
jgi:hypothetical protein